MDGGQEEDMNAITVMLIDDNPVFLRVATQFLEAHDGITVVGAIDGREEALVQAQTLQPQIVLVDLAMPDVPGLSLIPLLRLAMPDVGIIALTVMNTESFRQAALTAGADVFVPKAAMRTELLPAIQQLVQTDRGKTVGPVEPADHTTASRRILLVIEDDPYLLRLYGRDLRSAGYDVRSATTLQEARDLTNRTRFDVLLCDIPMDDDLSTHLLRESSARGAQVVMVSSHPQYRQLCKKIGVDFFLEKPVAIGTLVALVDRLMARQSPVG
jgi:DNA-binding response OmpR family regulator